MPLYKRGANRILTTIENRVLGTQLTDLHTGYRAYGQDLLLNVPFLRNALDFSFDSELLMQASHFGFRIAEVPAADALLRSGVLDPARPGDRLRAEDAVGGGAAGPAPQPILRSRKYTR